MGAANLFGRGTNSRVKIILDRSITNYSTTKDFTNGSGGTDARRYFEIPYATIGFVPRFILLWNGYERAVTIFLNYVDDIPYSYNGHGSNQGQILVTEDNASDVYSMQTYELTGNAYVNTTGVRLPASGSFNVANMIAIK